MSRRNRTSPSFNNEIPLRKLFPNTPYTIKTDVQKEENECMIPYMNRGES